MEWLVALGSITAIVLGAVVLSSQRWRDPYDPKLHPREAPPRGTPGRAWWQRRARTGPGPGPPI